jgi:cysteine desulfurase
MNKEIYLDNASTTKVDLRIKKEMDKFLLEDYGNPSSQHKKGDVSSDAIEKSRKIIADSIGAKSKEIIFCGSGTEANNFILKGLFWKEQEKKTLKNHIITTKIEHDCILNSCRWLEDQGAKVTYLEVDSEGFVDLEELKKSITNKTFLMTVIHGNNEIGTIQNIEAIGKLCKEKGVLFHTDACQSYTKTNIDVNKQNIDLMTINAHKIYGPKGIGGIYIREGVELSPLIHGGGQEFGLRSGTENVAGIVGFAQAVEISSLKDIEKMISIRDYFIDELLKIPKVKINGPLGERRLANNINVSFTNIEGESIASLLNSKRIFVSVGSACSSHTLEPSHVLLAIGKTPLEANSSIRISLSKDNTLEEINFVLEEIKKIVERLRRISPIK